jgi:hypothetical protein
MVNDAPIGWAMHHVTRSEDGQGEVSSTVRIEKLTLDQFLQQGFGRLGNLIARSFAADDTTLNRLRLRIANTMRFDNFGELESFDCTVQEDSWGDLIQLKGSVRDGELFVRAYLGVEQGESALTTEPVYQATLPLPPEKIVVDSLSPRPRFGQLHVGQRWQFESYNPLAPTQPLQTLEAHVTERRALRYDGQEVMTLLVVYRAADDGGLSLQQDLGEVWVTPEGSVLRQTFRWGQMTLEFERLPDSSVDSNAL